MPEPKDVSRRAALSVPAAFFLAPTACAAQDRPASGAKTLVAYFTRSGNTRVIAELLRRDLGADLFEIVPTQPYPADYEANVAQAARETSARFLPPLKAKVDNLAAYDTLYLGLPIWGQTAPPVIRSFLAAHDLRGKSIRPFITHGGYGPGDSVAVLKAGAPGATFQEPFVLEADQERRTIGLVRSWLGKSA
jgi:flavodoxin